MCCNGNKTDPNRLYSHPLNYPIDPSLKWVYFWIQNTQNFTFNDIYEVDAHCDANSPVSFWILRRGSRVRVSPTSWGDIQIPTWWLCHTQQPPEPTCLQDALAACSPTSSPYKGPFRWSLGCRYCTFWSYILHYNYLKSF